MITRKRQLTAVTTSTICLQRQRHVLVVLALVSVQWLGLLLNESNYTQARPRDEDGDGGNDGGSDGKDVLFNSTAIKPRIIGGTPTIAGRFPYHVSLLNQFGGHSCGGTLIAPDLVLTAAHCDELSAAHVGRYDRLNPSEPFEQYTIVEQTIHPAYQAVYFNYDFMILKLSGSAQRFPVVTLNTDPNLPSTEPDLNRVTAVGFGVTEYDFETGTTNDPSYILQTVDLQAITNEQCEQSKDLDNTEAMYRNGYKGLITADMLCADGQGDTCLGDSGGPLIVPGSDLSGYEDVQVGVTSWGFGCGSVEFPGVYSRVAHQYEWIREQVCTQSSAPPMSFDCTNMEQVVPGEVVQVTVIIRMDDYPNEVGWLLTDETKFGVTIEERLPGYYTSTPIGTTIYETFNVTERSTYSFTLVDLNGDGLCCSSMNGPGSYLVVYGTNETGEVIASGGGDFGTNAFHTFTVPDGSTMSPTDELPSDVPSLSPNEFPSLAPSSVPTSSPSITPVPTLTPSLSLSPSMLPTITPSEAPSLRPSQSSPPTVSESPSMAPSSSSASSLRDSTAVASQLVVVTWIAIWCVFR